MTRAVWLVVIGIVSVQAGAAFAKDLFGTISPTSMVFLRLVTSTVVLLAVARPSMARSGRRDWLVVAAFGASLGTMNWAIYQSFARIPLGLAVTIEFIGPLSLAVLGSAAPGPGLVALAALGVVPARLRARRPSTRSASASCSWRGRPGRRTSSSAPGPASAGPGWTVSRSPAPSRRCCSPVRRSCRGTALLGPTSCWSEPRSAS